jgi:peptidoglycan/LPS O-acetylase OafA/YrhL
LLAFNSLSRSARGTVQFVILYPVTVLLTAAISVFSYHLIEVPGRGIGSAIIGRYGWGGSDFRLRAQSARRNRQAKAL